VVNTTLDDLSPGDGLCSLRAAITEANNGSSLVDCHTPGTTEPDAIYFNIGSGVPVIDVTTDLPAITQALTIWWQLRRPRADPRRRAGRRATEAARRAVIRSPRT